MFPRRVLEHYGGAIGEDQGLLDATAAVLADADNAMKRLKIARDCTLAPANLKRANRCWFGTLWANLENDQYLTNLTAAYSLLVNFKPLKRDKPVGIRAIRSLQLKKKTALLLCKLAK